MAHQIEVPTVVALDTLTPDQKNARRRTERSHRLIERSISQFGAGRSILVDEDGKVLAGNGTLEAAASVGIDKVLLVPADGNTLVAVQRSDLSETQKAELAIADNRTSDLSEFSGEALAQLLEDDSELDLSPYWSPEEFAALVDDLDETEPPAPPATKELSLRLTFADQAAHERFLLLLTRLAEQLPHLDRLEDRLEEALANYLEE